MRVSRDESGINVSRTTEPAAPFSSRVSRQIYPKPFRLIEQPGTLSTRLRPLVLSPLAKTPLPWFPLLPATWEYRTPIGRSASFLFLRFSSGLSIAYHGLFFGVIML